MLSSDTNIGQQGIALLGAMVIVLILSLLATTLLNLAGQEAISANAGNQAAVAQQLADAASELVVAWFHDPRSTAVTPRIASQLEKRNRDAEGALSFFDPTGRSQFVGTANQPDYLFHAENASENQVSNDPEAGCFVSCNTLDMWKNSKCTRPRIRVFCAPSTPLLQPIPIRLSGNPFPFSLARWTCRP